MAVQNSVAVRNARLDSWEDTIGASPTLELRTGDPPATCATADSGTLLVTISPPADFMAAAASGSKAKNGTWTVNASAAGDIGHYRIKSSGGTCHEQGTVTVTGGGGNMTVDNINVASGQPVTVTTFTKTAGNA